MNRLESELELMEYYRVIQSVEENRAIDKDEAAMKFVQLGYAEQFADAYYEGISQKELINKVLRYDGLDGNHVI